ncbi:MAG: 6-carboxytetrahydropterin synthase QueD [Ruminococcus sp.]|nr:6-carboxytetrahydropterin synthase QueD [Ruminococcus sp.]MCM1479720.1 6-carboxytetrahydropterin synthase QueD [Muribaculaceae bacterium]
MYTLKTETAFDSAHFLSGYKGKCANLHGHRWTVSAEIVSERLIGDGQLRGMVADFGDIKRDLNSLADELDHAFIYEKNSLREKTVAALREENFRLVEVDFRPTAENFAEYFYNRLSKMGYNVGSVTVYETPNNCATFAD